MSASARGRDRLRAVRVARGFSVFIGAVVGIGCSAPADVVARVDGRDIELQNAQAYVEAVTDAAWQDADARVASRLFDEYLVQAAVSVASEDLLADDQTDPGRRWNAVRLYAEDFCGPVPTVAPRDLKRAGDERMAGSVPKQVLLRQLLLGDAEIADEAHGRLQNGEDFVDVSRDLSRAPNAADGGDLGWVVQGTQPEEVEEVIFDLAAGEVSRPMTGPGGFHIFQALEVREEGAPLRDRIEWEVRRSLEDRLARNHLDACVDRAVEEAGVRVFSENLWFDYSGRFAEANDEE